MSFLAVSTRDVATLIAGFLAAVGFRAIRSRPRGHFTFPAFFFFADLGAVLRGA